MLAWISHRTSPRRQATVDWPRGRQALIALLLGACALLGASVQAQSDATPTATRLPPEVGALLARAQVPAEALSAVVLETRTDAAPLLSWRADAPSNPASTLKLVTTYAALDRLGPDFHWQTRIYSDGPVRDGTLHGNLYLQGGGDPKLVSERLWLLLRRVQGLGIATIAGDIVLDRSALALPETDPGAFDGEPLKPYNAAPDALLINYRSQVFGFVPDPESGSARITLEPPLAGVELPSGVPLETGSEACGDWRAALRADFSDARRPRFDGRYAAACGMREWPIAHPDPNRLAARAIVGVWQSLGGRLDGEVREGRVPSQARLRLSFDSPALAEIVRETNKYSNNVMAQQIFLALGQAERQGDPAGWDDARLALERWWRGKLGADARLPEVGNGSGLGRDTRISAQALARLLQQAWNSALMPDLAASLPASAVDGTLRRSGLDAGLAHLKTGSLRDVQALAGYVHGADGRRRVLVAIVNHPQARAAKPALEALVRWAAQR